VAGVFDRPQRPVAALLRAIRLHQWVKNLIIFVPVLTAHELLERTSMIHALSAFVAFSFCASAIYVLNDLLDLEADRRHPRKRNRPFAAGDLPIPVGLAIVPAGLLLSIAVAWPLSWGFFGVLGIYVLGATAYSLRIKQVVLLDVFFLAGLYAIRLIAGHVATGIRYSAWLLGFSLFIFLSLALVKRFTELAALRLQNRESSHGRGYVAGDLELVATLGIVNGCLAALVVALYVSTQDALVLYRHPTRLLLICPLFLYWISRVWLLTHRGKMYDDPIVFALKDWVSYLVGALILGVLWLATEA
jgi:4-hydroxybenzoate polyprenyltransferase